MTSGEPRRGRDRLNRADTWVSIIVGVIGILAFLGIANVSDLFGRSSEPTAAQVETRPPKSSSVDTRASVTAEASAEPNAAVGSKSIPTARRSSQGAELLVSPNPVPLGQPWSIAGTGFPSSAVVTIYAGSDVLGQVKANVDGEFVLRFSTLTKASCQYSDDAIRAHSGNALYAWTSADFCQAPFAG